MTHIRLRLLVSVVGLAACVGGCQDWDWGRGDFQAKGSPDSVGLPRPTSAALRDTIGEHAWVEGMRKMHLRGYGIVVGLGTRGSTQCPRAVRDQLLSEMYKRPQFTRAGSQAGALTPERMLDDPDTAVVVVEGEVPAAAVAGSRFDVLVTALPGTQTTSLRRGRLFTCDLQIYRMLSPSAGITGEALARAAGPVFVNPFSDRPGAATRSPGRLGHVMGGGVLIRDRRIRLVLANPSYSKVRAMASRINARFPEPRKVADPVSPSFVQLRVPADYADDPKHFLALVRHLYLPRQSGFAAVRARALAEEIVKDGAPYEDIALSWEGLGRTVLPTVRKLYSHQNQEARYYAALAGLRLEDSLAVEIIAGHALDPQSAHRFEAIRALAKARELPRAARPLQSLLNDDEPAVRVAAYEALLDRGDPVIASQPIGADNFVLDLVPSTRGNLVHVKRSAARRIALFGEKLRLAPPLFYAHPTGELTLNAYEGDEKVTIVRNTSQPGRSFPTMEADFDLVPLIELLGSDPPRVSTGTPSGLSVDYAVLVHLLHELCDMQSVNARLVMEQPSITELFGPLRPAGRPESELE